jgi:tRNA 2-thiouridine synthesizing protein A
MDRLVDARGLSCPLPLVKARAALGGLQAGDVLVVLATDPEAPIDLAALAADAALEFDVAPDGAGWRITLLRPGGPGSPAG